MGIRMRAKIAIAFLSISLIASFGLTSNQAFALGHNIPTEPESCADCDALEQEFLETCSNNGAGSTFISPFCEEILRLLETCRPNFCRAIGGDMIQMETTSVLAAGAQYTAAWMIPVIVSGIGIAIVIARKF